MPARGSRRFFVVLGAILLVALGVRVAFVLGVARYDEKSYDAAYYELQARTIADGHGYVDPFQFLPGAPHRSTTRGHRTSDDPLFRQVSAALFIGGDVFEAAFGGV